MKDIDFIRKFSKITITGICKKLNVNRSNVIMGTTTDENIKDVREEIESEIAKLYLKEEKNNGN
jgi:hypothetical protein